MKAPRLKLEKWMAPDVADAGVLKHNVVRLLLKHPQGINLGDFSGAFYKLHGHHPQLALHKYSSLKYLLTDMKNMVVLEKNSLTTIAKLAVGTSLDSWLNKEKEMQSLMDEETDPWTPPPFLDTDFPVLDSTPQKVEHEPFCCNSMTSQAGASLSCDLDCSASTSKTLNQNVLGREPAPTEVSTLLSDLLKRFTLGLQVKKLQVFLLISKGFDLKKFSIAQGYKDTLEFLEQQMPELKITYHENRCNCVVKQAAQWPKTSQVSTSPSCDLDSFASKAKTMKQYVLRKKTAPTEVLALVSYHLNTYLSGLRVKKLQEHLLNLKGFDLKKFSIAQGYKDTLEFLEYQMPELKITYNEKRCKSTVKQASQRPKTPQVSTSPSCDLDSSASKAKTMKQNVLRKKTAPTEVLALLSKLLKRYTLGLRVKKLQEFLLTLNGFDLEKFSISEGYKDTLEFLENQMPELKFEYRECRHNCIVKQAFQRPKTPRVCTSSSDLDSSASKAKILKPNVLRQKTEVLALVSCLLNTHLSGLRVKKLQERLLNSKGFDLEKFSIAQHYKDTLEFLEHQMPELKITYRESRCNCVIKQASQRPKTSQVSTSPSCDLDSSASKAKTMKQYVLRKKTDPTEVSTLLSNLLKSYTLGLRVKKLQEFLLISEGFDLKKFSIAQGYKDTLEFLEQQMPELKITYHICRHNCVVKQGGMRFHSLFLRSGNPF